MIASKMSLRYFVTARKTDKVFRTIIPRNVRLSEAPSFGKSIMEYDPKSKGAESYDALSKEVIRRSGGYYL